MKRAKGGYNKLRRVQYRLISTANAESMAWQVGDVYRSAEATVQSPILQLLHTRSLLDDYQCKGYDS